MDDIALVHPWYNNTTLHPLGFVAILVLGAAIFFLPRRLAIVPMLIGVCFVAPAQRIVFLNLDFNLLRILILLAWLRVLIRGEVRPFRWKAIDTVLLAWMVAGTIASSLLYTSMDVMIYRAGFLYDAAGTYFLSRVMIRGYRDIYAVMRSIAVISLPVAVAFLIELNTGRNMFSVFGGVTEYTQIRSGRLRCQGAFAHPILAGVFWASLLPMLGALWRRHGWGRILAPLGVLSSLIIILSTASNTPLIAMFIVFIAVAVFPLRNWLSWIRWGALFAMAGLHLVMNHAVWHLLTRVNLVDGATGWYRFKLIDEFLRHFGDWWLIGSTDYSTWWRWDLSDLTNQYVFEGVNGGLITLVLFILTIVFGFRGIGAAQRRARRSANRTMMSWALGASLFVHCSVFIAVSYFSQMILIWYLTLAMIAVLTPAVSTRTRLISLERPHRPRHRRRSGWSFTRKAPSSAPAPFAALLGPMK